MKKLLSIFLVFVALMFNIETKSFTLQSYFDGDISYYSINKVRDTDVDLGFCYVGAFDKNRDVIGESMYLFDYELNAVLSELDAKVVSSEVISSNLINVYAFTDKIDSSVKLKGKNVNLQIAFNDEYMVIGWPLIYGEI